MMESHEPKPHVLPGLMETYGTMLQWRVKGFVQGVFGDKIRKVGSVGMPAPRFY